LKPGEVRTLRALQQIHVSEAAQVCEAKFGAAEAENHARMGRQRSIRCRDDEITRHPEVNGEGKIPIQFDKQVLPPPSHAGDATSGKLPTKR
jgi:hypothetical protein